MFPIKNKFILMFIYFWETETDRVWVGKGQREGDTEFKAGSRSWAVRTEPDVGLEPKNCEIMTWAEVGHPTEPPRHPSNFFFLKGIYF